jgi:hypothetical protein
MALEIYSDDAMTVPIKQENVFTEASATHTLVGLIATDIAKVYKYTGGVYITLTDYTVVGTTLTLSMPLVTDEHVVVMPIDNVSMTFTGSVGASRSLMKKLVLHKGDTTTVYDALNIYSENLTVPVIELSEVSYGGLYPVGVDETFGIYGALALVTGVGINMTTDLSPYWLPDCAVVVNGQYVGDVLGHDATTIVLAEGTVIPTNGSEDTVQVLSTGDLRFSFLEAGPFTRMLSIPTLTAAAPTQSLWLKESVIIPADTIESPNMPFKLVGQTYPE